MLLARHLRLTTHRQSDTHVVRMHCSQQQQRCLCGRGWVCPPVPTSRTQRPRSRPATVRGRQQSPLLAGGRTSVVVEKDGPSQQPPEGQALTTQPTPSQQGAGLQLPQLPLPPMPSQVQLVSEFASQLVSSFSWPTLPSPEEVAPQGGNSDKTKDKSAGTPDILPYLKPVPVWELKHMRKLCHLTSLTYKMATVTPLSMRRKHGLELVTTSWACEIRQYEHSKTAEEVADEGDGMGVSVYDAKTAYFGVSGRQQPNRGSSQATQPPPARSNIVPLPDGLAQALGSTAAGTQQPPSPAAPASQQQAAPPKRWQSPAEMVASMVSDAAAAASAAAVTPLASAAGSLYAGLASLPIASALGAGPRSTAPAQAAAIMSAAAAAVANKSDNTNSPNHLAASLAAAAGPAAIAAAPGSSTRLAAPVQSTTGSPACPSDWFVCDDVPTCTRYFVIQGSDTIDHWKLNLTFDPVPFEDPALGIKVHRGAYEAAQILYDRYLPMVYEHLDSSPFAKICFTGHSIGGSLSILLALMYRHRGVIPAASLANLYTFGAPSIFCVDPEEEVAAAAAHAAHQGKHHNQLGSSLNALTTQGQGGTKPAESNGNGNGKSKVAKACQCGTEGARTPLKAVGLPENIVRNVVMARDIVPRAFACDYSLVADILKSWGPSFKSHSGLAHPHHKHLYYFTGSMMIMQPDGWHWFARPEPDHAMLPPGPEVYLLQPTHATSHSHSNGHHASHTHNHAPHAPDHAPAAAATNSKQARGSARSPAAPEPGTSKVSSSGQQSAGPVTQVVSAKDLALAVRDKSGGQVAKSVHEALFAFLDNPHPLDILADPGAYLEKGSISRYHNPDNYTAALGRLIFLKRKAEGRFPSWVHHAYSRSLGMEAAEAQARGPAAAGGRGAATPVEALSPWDSSDVDSHPALASSAWELINAEHAPPAAHPDA